MKRKDKNPIWPAYIAIMIGSYIYVIMLLNNNKIAWDFLGVFLGIGVLYLVGLGLNLYFKYGKVIENIFRRHTE